MAVTACAKSISAGLCTLVCSTADALLSTHTCVAAVFDLRQVSGVYWINTPTTSTVTPHRLQVQNDGDVVIYNGPNRAIWATNTFGR